MQNLHLLKGKQQKTVETRNNVNNRKYFTDREVWEFCKFHKYLESA